MKKYAKNVITLLTAGSLLLAAGCSAQKADSNEPKQGEQTQGETTQNEVTQSETTNTEETTNTGETIALTLWGSADDQTMLSEMVEDFKTQNADKSYDISIKIVDEGGTREEVLKDVEQAADVFCIPHDQLGALVEAGAVYENTKYVDSIKNNSIEGAIVAATYQDKIYGYPVAADTYYLTYDNTIFTEEDVKSLNTMLEKEVDGSVAKFGFEFGSAYYGSAFFFTNGGELFGADGMDDTKVNYNNAEGLEVAKLITTLKSQGSLNINADVASSQFTEGTLGAFVAGPWKANLFKENLGERYAVTKLPTIDFGNGEKQMISFAGYKMFCVNSFTQYPEEAMALADFLTSKENQMKRFQDRNYLPVNKELSSNEEIQSDPTIKAVVEQLQYSRPMPALPQMSKYWNPMAAFMRDAYDGVIVEADLQKALDNLVNDILAK